MTFSKTQSQRFSFVVCGSVVTGTLASLIAPRISFAQPINNSTFIGSGFTSLTQVNGLLTNIANWMYSFALVIGTIMFVWGGFLYFTARDDAQQVEKAKLTLVYGVIGLAVAMLAGGIPTVIQSVLNI